MFAQKCLCVCIYLSVILNVRDWQYHVAYALEMRFKTVGYL